MQRIKHPPIEVGEALDRGIEVAMLGYAAECVVIAAPHLPEPPSPAVWSGIADACAELEWVFREVKRSLSPDALASELVLHVRHVSPRGRRPRASRRK